jgi:glycosyltransferase involved in cell wall biosynthesis
MRRKYPFNRIAFIGTHLPRRCGIATFTSDLCESVSQEAPELDCLVVAINDIPEGYPYPERVRFEVIQNNQDYYRQMAGFLNMTRVDLVCLQHEYGIFGGPAGSHILIALRRLRMPLVTTLHSVLLSPDESQRQVLEEICLLSERIVVMSEKAIKILKEVYQVPEEKIDLIHHGIPDMPFVDPNYYKDLFGVEGRRVILTFGLISPNKGIEYMIEALPLIVKSFPDVVYIVLGVTHPNVKREHGEEYRLSLQRRARELNVSQHIIFHNRFVSLEELCRFLGSADIYVTPYINPQQIVSGTLAYSMGVGKAVVSTPYWYAEEMLAEGRGRLVPFRDAQALAETIIHLFTEEAERHQMRKRAYAFGRKMIWKEVARAYLETFQRATEERRPAPAIIYQMAGGSDPLDIDLPELNLNHLLTLTDDTGILQHARRIVPNLNEGYTTDDNARALYVALRAREEEVDKSLIMRLICRYLAFVDFAFNRKNGRFRNFLSYDRRWLEEAGSEDAHGRALWALGYAVKASHEEGIMALAMNLFSHGLYAVESFTSPRAWAYTILGLSFYTQRFPGDSNARRAKEMLAERLYQLYKSNKGEDWVWFEPILSYANAKLSEALIVVGRDLKKEELVISGLESLAWLLKVQTAEEGHFLPIANTGWRRNTPRSRFDQQPIEASTTISACYQAYLATREPRWREEMRRVFEWFLGRNDLGLPLYDYVTGGCHDGLHPDGVNGNEGAEATLSFLSALLTMRQALATPNQK